MLHLDYILQSMHNIGFLPNFIFRIYSNIVQILKLVVAVLKKHLDSTQ